MTRPMRFAAHVEVRLRPGIADPESATIERALPALGFDDVARHDDRPLVPLRGRGRDARRRRWSGPSALAARLLANPVMEDALGVASSRAVPA